MRQPTCHPFVVLTVDHATAEPEDRCAQENVGGGNPQKDAIDVHWEAVFGIVGLEVQLAKVLLYLYYIAAGQSIAIVGVEMGAHFVGRQVEAKLEQAKTPTAALRHSVAVATVVGGRVGCGSSVVEGKHSPADCYPSQLDRKCFSLAERKHGHPQLAFMLG